MSRQQQQAERNLCNYGSVAEKFFEIVETVTDEVERYLGVTEMVDDLFELSEELPNKYKPQLLLKLICI